MWIGCAVSVLGGLSGLLLRDQVREIIERDLGESGLTASDVDVAVNIGVASALIGALLGAAVWILHAVFIGRGRSWARITGSLCFAIEVFGFLASLVQPAPAVSRVIATVGFVVAAAVTVLIWQRPSSEFFEQTDRARQFGRPGQLVR